MYRYISMLALAMMAGAVVASAQFATAAGSQRPNVDTPAGWSAHDGNGGSEYFSPPGENATALRETIFPTQRLSGSLEETAEPLWRDAIANERVVDVKFSRITVTDGVPAYRVIVATVNAQNQGVYRVFVFKQYGQNVAAGELRFSDIGKIQAIGKPALDSLENMSAR